MKKRIYLLLALAIFLSACGNGGAGAPAEGGVPVYRDTVIWAQESDATTLDAHVGRGPTTMTVTTNIFSPLMRVDENGVPRPHLAESYRRLSELEWEFTIRQGVRFHDGSVMTVEDVKFSLDRSRTSPMVAFVLAFVDEVTITGENTIVIRTHEPFTPILSNLTSPMTSIVPQAVIERYGDEHFANNPVGTGPFKLVEWNHGDSIRLQAFEDYFGTPARTQNLIMRVIPEATQRVIALEIGEVDISYTIVSSHVSLIENNPDLVAFLQPAMATLNFYFNLERGPTRDIYVRRAISHAIDRELIISTILNERAMIATSIVPPYAVGFVPNLPTRDFDLERARQYMARSAYADGATIDIVLNNNQERIAISQVVQNMLAEIGIEARIRNYAQGPSIDAMIAGEHDMGLNGGMASVADADFPYFSNFHSQATPQGGNRSFVNDPEVDRLISAGRATDDPAERLEIYRELEAILFDMVPSMLLANLYDSVGVSNRVQGFSLNREGFHRFENVTVRD